jgi:hypothetical protein
VRARLLAVGEECGQRGSPRFVAGRVRLIKEPTVVLELLQLLL